MPCRFAALPVIAALLVTPAAGATPAHNAAADTGPEVTAPLIAGNAFGREVMLPGRTIVYLNGQSSWDRVFETLLEAFRSLDAFLSRSGIKPDGPPMTIYTETNDTGFRFRAARPVAEIPANPPKGDIAVGQAPSGKALKFVHRGAYDAIDTTYEAITNYLDERDIEAGDEFIEQYVSDLASGPNDMEINVFVPVKKP